MTLQSGIKRKSEREHVAQIFEAMALRVGATCVRDRYEIGHLHPREISLYLTKDGCTVNVDLDGDGRLGCFLAHWFFDDRRDRLFVCGFGGAGDTRSRPHHKSTLLADHAEDLCAMIEARLGRVGDGTAFVLEPQGA